LSAARFFRPGESVALRYVTDEPRLEMCWPCRVVADDGDLTALFIAEGTRYRAEPKQTAAEKRAARHAPLPRGEFVWRQDTLRLMFPGRRHAVLLFWRRDGDARELERYFVNMEEPFQRTRVGFDTQDHTLDIEVTPKLEARWRDEAELESHVAHGFFTRARAAAIRAEGEAVLAELAAGGHPCLRGWSSWSPSESSPCELPSGWDTEPLTRWA
jgi:predicted RNA-binding protein associated with RNAse of E/G family